MLSLGQIKPDWAQPAGVTALATTRQGGISGAPWQAFNLGDHVGDQPAAVAANRTLLRGLLHSGTELQWLQQVHGAGVVCAGHGRATPSADACWTDEPGIACAVLTADCLPVLFCDRASTVVAAAHAGWRGLAAGVLEATINALPVPSESLMAWLGPAIGPSMFEVGTEVREAFLTGDSSPAAVAAFRPAERTGHYFADIYVLAQLRLRAAGVTAVYGGHWCTVTDVERFFSYRRDGVTGRMATLIYLNPR